MLAATTHFNHAFPLSRFWQEVDEGWVWQLLCLFKGIVCTLEWGELVSES
jgi:hypothetical protein